MTSLAKSLSQLALRWRFTAYDQYASIYKAPANSKIVLYGAHNQLFTNLINKYFNHHFHLSHIKIFRQFENFAAVDPIEAAQEHSETIHVFFPLCSIFLQREIF